MDDMVRLQIRRQARSRRRLPSRPPACSGGLEVDLCTWDPQPRIVDADGRPAACEILSPPRERIVIDKSCPAPCFDEFFLWLRRNEIHEYAFVDLRYEKRGDLLVFEGRIAPAAMILPDTRRRARRDLARLRRLIDEHTTFRLSVRTLFTSRVRIAPAGLRFPLEVGAARCGLRSLLVAHDGLPDRAALRRFFGERAAAGAPLPRGERLYQVFVAGNRSRPSGAVVDWSTD